MINKKLQQIKTYFLSEKKTQYKIEGTICLKDVKYSYIWLKTCQGTET